MPELTIKAMEGVGTVKGHGELTCAITLLQDQVDCFVVCVCGWHVSHYLPMPATGPEALAYQLLPLLRDDLQDHGNLEALNGEARSRRPA